MVELQGIGPGPFCGMMLADMGAELIRVDRSHPRVRTPINLMCWPWPQKYCGRSEERSRRRDGVETGGKRRRSAPGISSRRNRALGAGARCVLARNPALVYGRMTGWGQYGSSMARAGHDINYISLSGVLHGIGEPGGKADTAPESRW